MIILNANKKKEKKMKKTASMLSLIAFLLILSYGISFCQEVDLSGTWEGTTEVPDAMEPERLMENTAGRSPIQWDLLKRRN